MTTTRMGLSRKKPLSKPTMIPGIWRYNPASRWVNSATFLACMPETVKAAAVTIEIAHGILLPRNIDRHDSCMNTLRILRQIKQPGVSTVFVLRGLETQLPRLRRDFLG